MCDLRSYPLADLRTCSYAAVNTKIGINRIRLEFSHDEVTRSFA
jgi:hypothetical protein